ncbi:MAG: acetyl-CoA carboxylase biotin carboxyl carrier protein [Chloroflexota bacterium]
MSEYLASRLPALLAVVCSSDVQELELREGAVHLRFHRSGTAGRISDAPQQLVLTEPKVSQITSPLVGTFYRAGEPNMPPLVTQGSHIQENTVIGIIESLHVFTDILAGRQGIISAVHATDGQAVEYGQVLFEVMEGE